MDFDLSEDQLAIVAAIEKICAPFDDDFWLARDREGGFPHEFHQAMARDGWLGICMPEEYVRTGKSMNRSSSAKSTISSSRSSITRRLSP